MEVIPPSFVCQFCCRQFGRSDALKRHWITCKPRKSRALDIPTLSTKTRGRKLRACDQCSRLKRACTSTEPCTQCASRGQLCTYKRWRLSRNVQRYHEEYRVASDSRAATRSELTGRGLNTTTSISDDGLLLDNADDNNMLSLITDGFPSKPTEFDLDYWDASRNLLDEHILGTSLYLHPTQLDIRSLGQFTFLDNFTQTRGFVTSFRCGSTEQRFLIATESSISKSLGHLLSLGSHNSRSSGNWIEITQGALTLRDEPYMRDANVVALLPKTHEIVSQIREMTVLKHYQSSIDMTWSTPLEALCYEFFHPTALQRHLALFWSCWYPNWPTIHRPTFDATEKSPSLVAAMALLGASLSPDSRDCAAAQIWFNVVEEMVFSNKIFSDQDVSNAWNTSSTILQRSQLDILQAAYCVCLVQTWEGCNRSKRRILRQRFNDLVYLARDIGLAQASLKTVDTSHPTAFDFEEYVLRESLIRICSYICNIDASFALFFRSPPRMSFSELIVELASPESCFQAETKEQCFVELKTWRNRSDLGNKSLTIRKAVELLSDPSMMATDGTRQVFPHLSVLNMFTLVHALYLRIHHVQTSEMRSLDTTNPVITALRQWKDLWSSPSRDEELIGVMGKESQVSTAWQNIGFIKHAPEYWLLIHLSLQKASAASTILSSSSLRKIAGCEDTDMSEVRSLIAGLKTGDVSGGFE